MAITLKGWVYNDDGTPANNLTVTCYDQVPNVIGTTSTDATGLWQFTSLSAGVTYDVKINNNNSIIRWIKGGEMHQVADLNLTGAQTLTALWDFTSGSLALPTQAAVVTQGRIGLTAAGGSAWFGDGTVSRTVATLDQTQTLTNKTLTSPTITGATLTSPTISGAAITTSNINGLGSAVTGTGSLVGSSAPTFTSGPYTNDWWRNSVNGTGLINNISGFGVYSDGGGLKQYPSGDVITTNTAAQTLTNKTITSPTVNGTPTITDPVFTPNSAGAMSGTAVFMYGTGTLSMPIPVDGHMKQVKAYGGSVTVTNPNSSSYGLFPPGSQTNVASFVINAGDSVSFYAIAGNWWAI